MRAGPQYTKYVNTLGTKTVPKTFDKFQELKYTDSEAWTELKRVYREVSWQTKAQKNSSTSSKLPNSSTPNSVIDKKIDNKIIQRRYYGITGNPRLDIDLTDHGNPKVHTIVPHYHNWIETEFGKVKRDASHDKALELWHKIANKDILE